MGVYTYVTGIRFMSSNNLDTRVGYVAEQEEQTFPLSDFLGFRVAMSQSGIRALQIVGKHGSCSQWAGDSAAMAVSDGLVVCEPIRRLAVSYDVSHLHSRGPFTHRRKGFKIVGIAVDVTRHKTMSELEANSLLRQAAWYPYVPPQDICLNAGWLGHSRLLNTGFQPLILLHFGGPAGRYLAFIIGLCVQFSHGLHSIEVYNEQNSCTRISKKLGRCDASEVPPDTLFKIDGRSGERIVAVDVAIQRRGEFSAAEAMLYGSLKRIRVRICSSANVRFANPPLKVHNKLRKETRDWLF